MYEVTRERKRGNGLEVWCVSLCSKAMAYQSSQNFAAALSGHAHSTLFVVVIVPLFSLLAIYILEGLYKNERWPLIDATLK